MSIARPMRPTLAANKDEIDRIQAVPSVSVRPAIRSIFPGSDQYILYSGERGRGKPAPHWLRPFTGSQSS